MASKSENDRTENFGTEHLVTTLADARRMLREDGNAAARSKPARILELPPIRVKMRVRFSGGTSIPEDFVSEVDADSCVNRTDLNELQAAESVVLAWINRNKTNAAQFLVDPVGSIFRASPDLQASSLRSLDERNAPIHDSPSRYSILHSVEVDADIETALPDAES